MALGVQDKQVQRVKLRADHVLLVIFSGNFIGILCARTLHFQFYAWYYHTLPFLLWQVRILYSKFALHTLHASLQKS